MRNKTFSCRLRKSLDSAIGRLFALNWALKRCRYSAKITAALPLVPGDRKNSGAAATASEKVAALVAPLCLAVQATQRSEISKRLAVSKCQSDHGLFII